MQALYVLKVTFTSLHYCELIIYFQFVIICNLWFIIAVHGDLRKDNAMLGPVREGSKGRSLLFIDFEWAGDQGMTRYPLNLNKNAFHNGAESGAFITQDHDMKMLQLW